MRDQGRIRVYGMYEGPPVQRYKDVCVCVCVCVCVYVCVNCTFFPVSIAKCV